MRRLPLRSPPRMRGKAKNRCRSCPLTRITPAYAGKRDIPPPGRTAPGDHPRVCGEKQFCFRLSENSLGSPPRVRGKVFAVALCIDFLRITPACAGKRTGTVCCQICAQDHPRVCGEKTAREFITYLIQGSPPRVRGKAAALARQAVQHGITPAYAGKSIRR